MYIFKTRKGIKLKHTERPTISQFPKYNERDREKHR